MTAKPKRNIEPTDVLAEDVTAEDVEWLWPFEAQDDTSVQGRIPAGMLTLVAGRPGQGKSLFTAYLAAEVSTRHHVLLSNLEDAWAQILRPRLEAAGANLRNVHMATPILPHDQEWLETFIVAHSIKLAILDPIAAHMRVSVYQDQECRVALTPLSQMAERTGCAIVMVHHTKKHVSRTAHPLEAIGGAGGGLTGACRLAYIFGPNPDDPDERILAAAKTNIGPQNRSAAFALDTEVEVPVVLQDGSIASRPFPRLVHVSNEAKVSASKVLQYDGGASKEVSTVKKAVAAEWLTTFLMWGPKAKQEVDEEATQAGLSIATVRRAADQIGVVKSRRGFGKDGAWFWELPPSHPALALAQSAAQMGYVPTLTGGDDEQEAEDG